MAEQDDDAILLIATIARALVKGDQYRSLAGVPLLTVKNVIEALVQDSEVLVKPHEEG